MQKQLSFSLDDISLFEDDDNQDFALVKMSFLSSGGGMNHCSISEDVLKQNAPTVLGKFITGNYDKWRDDTRGHEDEPQIFGYVPPNSKVTFDEKDGRTFAIAEGVISKLYATPIVQMFQKDNKRSVSCEFTANMGNEQVDGDTPIESFDIRAITILGKNIAPACKGADIEVMKFSEQDAENYYNNRYDTLSELQKFSERRKQEFMADKTYKVNKTELKDTAWGDVDKTALRNAVMGAKNKATLVHDVYALVEDGWEDSPSEHLKYPIMQLSGDTFYYNRYGLASALAYTKKENETSVVSKIEKLYKKFNLDDEEGENKEMAEEKFEIEGREAWGEVIDEVEKHEGKGVYVDSVEKDHIIYTKDKVRYRVDADVEVGKDDKKVHASIHWDTAKKDADQKEFEDDKKKYPEDDAHSTDKKDDKEVEKDDKVAKDEEKKMSLDANADMAAYYDMLETETDEYKALAKRVLEDEDRGLVMQDVLKMAHECGELREFKDAKMCEMRDMECNKVMAEVKEDLTDEQFKCMQDECMACKYEDVSGIANKYRAMAYANAKEKMAKDTKPDENKQFSRMAFDFTDYMKHSTALNADDVYKEVLKK